MTRSSVVRTARSRIEINAVEWQAEARGLQVERATLMRELLVKHAGRESHVLLLKRGWDANDTQRAERNAPDIRMWTLEAAGEGRFVLRRPMLRNDVSRFRSHGAGQSRWTLTVTPLTVELRSTSE